jgi:hypothetical protein
VGTDASSSSSSRSSSSKAAVACCEIAQQVRAPGRAGAAAAQSSARKCFAMTAGLLDRAACTDCQS